MHFITLPCSASAFLYFTVLFHCYTAYCFTITLHIATKLRHSIANLYNSFLPQHFGTLLYHCRTNQCKSLPNFAITRKCDSPHYFSLAFLYYTLPLQNKSRQNFVITRKYNSPHCVSSAFRHYATLIHRYTIYGFAFHNLT